MQTRRQAALVAQDPGQGGGRRFVDVAADLEAKLRLRLLLKQRDRPGGSLLIGLDVPLRFQTRLGTVAAQRQKAEKMIKILDRRERDLTEDAARGSSARTRGQAAKLAANRETRPEVRSFAASARRSSASSMARVTR